MIPFGTEEVTLYKNVTIKGDDGRSHIVWHRYNLYDCSWTHSRGNPVRGVAKVVHDSIRCRIPVDQTAPSIGDLLVLGHVYDSVTDSASANKVLVKYAERGAFRVAAVHKNDREGFPIPHIAALSE